MVSSQARRDQVALAMERGHSQRQACELMELPRSILNYRSVRAERDAPALDAMRRIAATYPRYGYRRVRIVLRREGHAMGPQRAYRLWRSAGLQLPRRRPRQRVATSRPRPLPAVGPNQVWAYDFIHDACANGQKLKCLTVIDEFTRESLAIGVAGSIRSPRVIEVLSRLVSEHGAPTFLRSDNGPEFVSNAILAWLAEAKIDTAPKEIEERIDGLDGVCESAVIGVPHPDLGEAVTAVVVTHPGHAVCEHAIIAALEGEIARFKVPKRVGFVDELPRNAMGKVQKNVLRDRYRDVG